MNKIDKRLVEQVKWEDDPATFDLRLHALGKINHATFFVVNPLYDPWIFNYINLNDIDIQHEKCIVWKINNIWIIKKFKSFWRVSDGYKNIKLDIKIKTTIEYNPDLAFLKFNVDDRIPFEDAAYEYVYYLDSKFTPDDNKIWVAKVKVSNINTLGEKDAGVVSPLTDSLPELIFNKDIPELTYNTDFNVPYFDLQYENVWYLDDQFNPFDKKIWAVKLLPSNSRGFKDKGYVKPVIEKNPDIPEIEFEITDHISYFDLCYEHVWMLEKGLHNDEQEIWAAKIVPKSPQGVKIVGNINVSTDKFDVVFISYNEPNAEANWQRVLEKAPYAKRVKGVKGIFEAHKQAAALAKTKMFYVVDGDAELDNFWEFDFKVNVFDMDCVHLWTSVNPINGLEYGYGGVKLFPRQLLLDAKTWNIDLTTGLGKLKLINKISNLTAFNYDEFTTWRSAFRECAKLSSDLILNNFKNLETQHRLKIWTTVGEDSHMGKYAIAGAQQGQQYGFDNYNQPEKLKLINDYDWMKNEFDKQCTKQ